MGNELAILGLGNMLYLEGMDLTLPQEKLVEEAFKRYAKIGLEKITLDEDYGPYSIRGKRDERMMGYHGLNYGLSGTRRMQRIIERPEVEAAVGVGFCGALDPEMKKGDIIIARNAAMSPYVIHSDQWKNKLAWGSADKELALAIGRKAEDAGYDVRMGNIYTVINTASETPEFIEELKEGKFDGIEMETAALYQLANAINKPCAVILEVSDNQAKENGCNIKKRVQELIDAGEHTRLAEIVREAMLETFKCEEQ